MSPEYRIQSVAAIQSLANQLAKTMTGGELVLLNGELGSGKTTFVQAFAAALGVEAPVTSPTFTIVSEYPVSQHPTIHHLIHADLYRLDTPSRDPIIQEVLVSADNADRVTVIEWAEKLAVIPPSAITLTFRHGATPNERLVIVTETKP